MSGLRELRSTVLQDERITRTEVAAIREYIRQDGQLDLDDVKVLIELLISAKEVCPEFDELFFPALKEVLLSDGQIGCDEQFYLLKMLYSDGHIRDSERRFLNQLQREIKNPSPEFVALCDTAAKAKSRNWDLGGIRR